jgi:hypothetical protein
MGDRDLEAGTKEPGSVSGAPYPPARRHSDGPERPRRHVPGAAPTAEPEHETDGDDPAPTDVESEEDQDDGDS